jgi:hypothetical protein
VIAGYLIIWLLIFTGPYSQTVHPVHFPTLRACMVMAASYPAQQSECVSVSRPVILPGRNPLVVPQADA